MRMHNPPHPGEFITEVYLTPNNLSARELAAKLRVAAGRRHGASRVGSPLREHVRQREAGKKMVDLVESDHPLRGHEGAIEVAFVQLVVFPQPRGDGIGLAHARALVRRLGGTINVESEPDRGTVFKVTLPKRWPLPVSEMVT